MKTSTAEVVAVESAEKITRPTWADLNEARYATPGTPENRAYRAKLDAITAQAMAMRAEKAGR